MIISGVASEDTANRRAENKSGFWAGVKVGESAIFVGRDVYYPIKASSLLISFGL